MAAVSEVLPFSEHKQSPFREHGAPAFYSIGPVSDPRIFFEVKRLCIHT